MTGTLCAPMTELKIGTTRSPLGGGADEPGRRMTSKSCLSGFRRRNYVSQRDKSSDCVWDDAAMVTNNNCVPVSIIFRRSGSCGSNRRQVSIPKTKQAELSNCAPTKFARFQVSCKSSGKAQEAKELVEFIYSEKQKKTWSPRNGRVSLDPFPPPPLPFHAALGRKLRPPLGVNLSR